MKGVFRKDGSLRVGSTKCPWDSEPLHWQGIGGMRVRHVYADGDIYRARCPKCCKGFNVAAGKESQG